MARGSRPRGPDHPDVATSIHNLGQLAARTDDLDTARRHFERALVIEEKAFGPHHPHVLEELEALADVYRRLGDPTKVAELEARVRASRTRPPRD